LAAGSHLTSDGDITFHIGSGGLLGPTSGILGGFTVRTYGNAAGTISNPAGDVVLSGPITFFGQDLAIIAQGNIYSTTTTSINLSSKTSNGGNLTLIAGYNFTQGGGSPSFPSVDPIGTYTIEPNGATAAGGSILLPGLSVNTSSSAVTALPQTGGNVLAVANGGTLNAGLIQLGTINTSGGTNGIAGRITLIGSGGIKTGNITANGIRGGNVTIFAERPTIIGNAITLTGGQMRSGGSFGVTANTTPDGAAIDVEGTISSKGSVYRGGNITLIADQQIEVGRGIIAMGTSTALPNTPAGGNVNMTSLFSRITVGSAGINTSGMAVASNGRTGAAGSIKISAASYINSGTLKAVGANNIGTGAAGAGGSITLTTSQITTLQGPMAFGKVTIKGYIDARGGSGSSTKGDATSDGGAGGFVNIDAGSIVVTGVNAGNSVWVSGGVKGKLGVNNGLAGDIAVTTYSMQQLPSNFDLTSTKATIPVRPGGLLSVGFSSPVNGFAGNLTSDITLNKKSLLFGPADGLFATQGATGFGTHITLDIVGDNSSTFTGAGVRNPVKPADAVVNYQADRSQLGAITINENELNGTVFSAFKMPAGTTIVLTGHRPTLTLPASTLLAGNIVFQTAGAIGGIDFGSGAFVNTNTGTIDANATAALVLSGKAGTWTNNGTLVGSEVVIARTTTSALTFKTGTTGITQVSEFELARGAGPGFAVNFIASGVVPGNYSAPVELGKFALPSMFKSNATAIGLNANLTPSLALNFTLSETIAGTSQPGTAFVEGQGSFKTITIKGLTAAKVATNLALDDGLTLAAQTTFTASATASLAVADNTNLTAGALKGAPAFDVDSNILLNKTDIQSSGTMVLKGSTVNIGDGNTLTNVGSKLAITASSADAVLGSNNSFTVRGGNLIILAKGIVSGATNNTLRADSITGTATGGVEVGSGLTAGTLAKGFAKVPATVPSLGAGVGITEVNFGAVLINPATGGGVIDLATAGTGTVRLNRGAVVIDAISPSSSVTFGDGTVIQVKSSKPISQVTFAAPADGWVIDTDEDDFSAVPTEYAQAR
jgi:hypothetical protein